MFNIGDTVLYGSQGVCKIVGTDVKKFDGERIDYLILKPVYDKDSTLFVPSANERLLSKIRSVLSAEQIYKIIKTMPDEDTIWIDDENERKIKYKKIISDGDRRKLVQLIKTLYLHKKEQQKEGKKLHQSDEVIMKQAEKLLYDEFALVLNIQPDKVLPFIMEQFKAETKNN